MKVIHRLGEVNNLYRVIIKKLVMIGKSNNFLKKIYNKAMNKNSMESKQILDFLNSQPNTLILPTPPTDTNLKNYENSTILHTLISSLAKKSSKSEVHEIMADLQYLLSLGKASRPRKKVTKISGW